jgi:predicted nucleic acid-binding protein
MLVLDTNVLSALMQAQPERNVIRWLDQQPAESVWTTTITVFEIQYGLQILPNSKRRKSLEDLFERVLQEGLGQRVLSFDASAAKCAAILAAYRHKRGRIVDFRDTLIAGIAVARRAKIITRNTRHFDDLDIEIINPWKV